MMADIYSQASAVIMWLAEPNSHVSRRVARGMRWKPGSPEEPSRASMDPFNEHRYWSRTWIMQEILLASTLELYYGSENIAWSDFTQFAGHSGSDGVKYFAINALSKSIIEPCAVMSQALQTECEDERDIWFGVRGLLDARYRTKVDY
jgi:hypothetical protein